MAVVVQITPYHDRSRRRRRSTILYLVSSRLDVHAGHCLNAHASRPLTSSSKSASFTATPIWLTPSFSIIYQGRLVLDTLNDIPSTIPLKQHRRHSRFPSALYPIPRHRLHLKSLSCALLPVHSVSPSLDASPSSHLPPSISDSFGTPSGNRTVLRPLAVPLQIDRLGAETRSR
ncbi:hypothetical protein R3P38DRAFT_3182617 [Favolaschia claudopus]|uniref:Uncharacterized protein n=1 Tax=Favolaschia claudopus TaxID=2862362 RepID=A0AAW0CJZ4_9AGAR